MKDIPIIFSAPMVRALLDGRKTMTRRLAWRTVKDPADDKLTIRGLPASWQRVQPGDRLWVREGLTVCSDGLDYTADGEQCHDLMRTTPHCDEAAELWNRRAHIDGPDLHRTGIPSIHMPRWASRLTLTVTATKVERLQAITELDARAEGLSHDPFTLAKEQFEALWNHLHGSGAWDANPEVVAISFTVERRNVDAR